MLKRIDLVLFDLGVASIVWTHRLFFLAEEHGGG